MILNAFCLAEDEKEGQTKSGGLGDIVDGS